MLQMKIRHANVILKYRAKILEFRILEIDPTENFMSYHVDNVKLL